MSIVYNLASQLCYETVKIVREKYNVKIVANFEIRGYLVIFSFATDMRMQRLTYFSEELQKGISAITVTALLAEAFSFTEPQ